MNNLNQAQKTRQPPTSDSKSSLNRDKDKKGADRMSAPESKHKREKAKGA